MNERPLLGAAKAVWMTEIGSARVVVPHAEHHTLLRRAASHGLERHSRQPGSQNTREIVASCHDLDLVRKSDARRLGQRQGRYFLAAGDAVP